MQFHRTKNGGCLDMTHLKMVASFCAASALALLLVMTLDLDNSPCGQQNDLDSFRQSVFLSSINKSISAAALEELRNASEITCAASQAIQATGELCQREWEKPSVTSMREWEKVRDENSPELQRTFTPVGVSAFLFIRFEAYRGGPNNFSVIGLSPMALLTFGNPRYECFWIPKSGDLIVGNATAYFPGRTYALQYVGTVILCDFDQDVGTDGTGGSLEIVVRMGSQDMTGLPDAQFIALTEDTGEYNGALFEGPLKYDFMYCGSPLHGPISPEWVREWIAWHVRMLGPRSHFILYDGGGLHDDVRKVLAPWVKLGRVTIVNFRQQGRYHSKSHCQAVALNDCLMQAKRLAEWAFFFDMDEYLHVRPDLNLHMVMQDIKEAQGRNAQQVTFDQRPMNPNHCVKPENGSDVQFERLWAIEKLVFRRTQVTELGGWLDHKYAVQTRYTLVVGTHNHDVSLLPDGITDSTKTIYYEWKGMLRYYHFRTTVNVREELCKEFVDPGVNETKFNNVTHVYDGSLSSLVDAVKLFELETVGSQPFIP